MEKKLINFTSLTSLTFLSFTSFRLLFTRPSLSVTSDLQYTGLPK